MASRHQGRHKPRHHNHAVKPAHTFKTSLPPLPKPGDTAVSASTSVATAVADVPQPAQTAPETAVAAQ